MGPRGMHPLVLRQLGGITVRPASIISGGHSNWGRLLREWKEANVTIFNRGRRIKGTAGHSGSPQSL